MRGKKRLHIPQSLRIGRAKWRVRFVKGLRNDTGDMGSCHYASRLIKIDAWISRAEQEITFVHEVLHAIFPNGGHTPRREEKIVKAMEKPLYQLLRTGQLGMEAP